MSEKELEKTVVECLEKMGAWVMPKTHMSTLGIPDRIICLNGKFLAVEFKKSKTEAFKKTGRIVMQKKRLEEIKQAGGWAWLVYPENAYQFLKWCEEQL